MSADLALPVAGLRSLLMQALHPLAMAGVPLRIHLRRPGSGHASLGLGAAHPGSCPRHGRGYRLPVRGGRSRSPAPGARSAGHSVLAAGTLVGTAAG